MSKSLKTKKINSDTLELIMRDVLHGMADFTEDSSCGSQLVYLEIIAVESPDNQKPATASILPFPGKTSAKK